MSTNMSTNNIATQAFNGFEQRYESLRKLDNQEQETGDLRDRFVQTKENGNTVQAVLKPTSGGFHYRVRELNQQGELVSLEDVVKTDQLDARSTVISRQKDGQLAETFTEIRPDPSTGQLGCDVHEVEPDAARADADKLSAQFEQHWNISGAPKPVSPENAPKETVKRNSSKTSGPRKTAPHNRRASSHGTQTTSGQKLPAPAPKTQDTSKAVPTARNTRAPLHQDPVGSDTPDATHQNPTKAVADAPAKPKAAPAPLSAEQKDWVDKTIAMVKAANPPPQYEAALRMLLEKAIRNEASQDEIKQAREMIEAAQQVIQSRDKTEAGTTPKTPAQATTVAPAPTQVAAPAPRLAWDPAAPQVPTPTAQQPYAPNSVQQAYGPNYAPQPYGPNYAPQAYAPPGYPQQAYGPPNYGPAPYASNSPWSCNPWTFNPWNCNTWGVPPYGPMPWDMGCSGYPGYYYPCSGWARAGAVALGVAAVGMAVGTVASLFCLPAIGIGLVGMGVGMCCGYF